MKVSLSLRKARTFLIYRNDSGKDSILKIRVLITFIARKSNSFIPSDWTRRTAQIMNFEKAATKCWKQCLLIAVLLKFTRVSWIHLKNLFILMKRLVDHSYFIMLSKKILNHKHIIIWALILTSRFIIIKMKWWASQQNDNLIVSKTKILIN